jgi:hypothetical protein
MVLFYSLQFLFIKGKKMTQDTITQKDTKEFLTVNDTIIAYNEDYINNLEIIKTKRTDNKETIRLVLNLFLKQIKELKNHKDFINYTKKGLLNTASVRIERDLNKDFKKLIKSIFLYLLSGSNLNLNDLSVTAFNQAMELINIKKVDKFKSNEDLVSLLKQIKDDKETIKAKKKLNIL